MVKAGSRNARNSDEESPTTSLTIQCIYHIQHYVLYWIFLYPVQAGKGRLANLSRWSLQWSGLRMSSSRGRKLWLKVSLYSQKSDPESCNWYFLHTLVLGEGQMFLNIQTWTRGSLRRSSESDSVRALHSRGSETLWSETLTWLYYVNKHINAQLAHAL